MNARKYLKQKGGRCGLYSYYNLAVEMNLPSRPEILRMLDGRVLRVGGQAIHPGQGLHPDELGAIIAKTLPAGYEPHLISNDWEIFLPNCRDPTTVKKHLQRILRHRHSFRETHSKRQAESYLRLISEWGWKITTEQITLDLLEKKTDSVPLIASCLPMLLHPQMKNGRQILQEGGAVRWDPEKAESHFFVVARASRGAFKVIDSNASVLTKRKCTYRVPKRDVHASIAMDDQPTIIEIRRKGR